MSPDEWILENNVWIRIGAFVACLVLLAACERFAPRRKLHYKKSLRWFSNIGIGALNIAIIRLIFPLMAIDAALVTEAKGWGILNYFDISYGLSVLVGFLILDLSIYFQHVLFHAIPLFWRFHRVHHVDLDFDVSTGQRFHPIEITVSMAIKISLVVAFGIKPLAVLFFEIILNATSLFTHSNWSIHPLIDRALRWFLVTPDMHRIHHSVYVKETDSNFGFNLSLWDRIFGTYRKKPKDGHKEMVIGLKEFKEEKYLKIDWMLFIPFMRNKKIKKTKKNNTG